MKPGCCVIPGADDYIKIKKRCRQVFSPQDTVRRKEDVDALPTECLVGGVGVTGSAAWSSAAAAASGPPLPALRAGPLLHPPGAEAPVQRRGHHRRVRLLPRVCQGGGAALRRNVGLPGQVWRGPAVCLPGRSSWQQRPLQSRWDHGVCDDFLICY